MDVDSLYDEFRERGDEAVGTYTDEVLRELAMNGIGGYEAADEVPFDDLIHSAVGWGAEAVLADFYAFAKKNFTDAVALAVLTFAQNRGLDVMDVVEVDRG